MAMDRFVPHETAEHFIEKNKRNRVKFSPSIKECKFICDVMDWNVFNVIHVRKVAK